VSFVSSANSVIPIHGVHRRAGFRGAVCQNSLFAARGFLPRAPSQFPAHSPAPQAVPHPLSCADRAAPGLVGIHFSSALRSPPRHNWPLGLPIESNSPPIQVRVSGFSLLHEFGSRPPRGRSSDRIQRRMHPSSLAILIRGKFSRPGHVCSPFGLPGGGGGGGGVSNETP